MKLIKGYSYQLLKKPEKLCDLNTHKNYVYLGEKSDWMIYDRFPEYLIRRTYHFYDEQTGSIHEWIIDGKEDTQSVELSKNLKEMGGWARPKAGEIKSKRNENTKTDVELLKPFLPYWKQIVEGEHGLQNLYEWLDEQEPLLKVALPGNELVKFRLSPFHSMQHWLGHFEVPYTVSTKYGWMDKIVH